MAATPRRSQLRIAYSSTFAAQGSFGSALADLAIDAVFSLSDEDPRLEIITKDDEIIDCTGQYKIDEIVQGKYARISFGLEADAAILAGLLGWAFGVVSGNDRLMLGPTVFQGPVTTLIYGHAGGSDGLKFKDMALNSIRVMGRVNERIKVSVEFVGNGSPTSAAGFPFPDCSTVTPIYLKDGTFSVNSTSYLADTREFEFSFSNNLLADEDPFEMDSVDVKRMERADMREVMLKWKVFGNPGGTLHTAALNKQKWPFSFRIGPSANGVTFDAVTAILKQDGGPSHDGEARRSVLGLMLEPLRVVGNTATPVKATRNV